MKLLSVNVGRPRGNPWKSMLLTGIDKRPINGPIMVTAPLEEGIGAVGLAGDRVYDVESHGGPSQAVYAYAREDLDMWQGMLNRELPNGVFGENLTTTGFDVNDALIGERWKIGSDVVLEVSAPRIPCGTFQGWLGLNGWIKWFTKVAKPGTYLSVISEGEIRAGDPIDVVYRPDHDVTAGLMFRAETLEPELLPRLLTVDSLPEEVKEYARRRLAPGP